VTEQFSNLGQTTINQVGGIGATDTTVVVSALNGTNPSNSFPSSGNFRVIFGTDTSSEIALCTAVNTTNNTLTIVRGQEGTNPTAWVNGTAVTISLTAQALVQARADVYSVGPFASRPAQGLPTGSRYQSTDGGVSVWDPGLGAWRPEINGVLGYQPPVAASWTPINQGTSTLADSNGSLFLTGVNEVGFQLRMFGISVANPGFAEACFTINTPNTTGGNSYSHVFVGFRESSSSKVFLANLTLVNTSNGLSGLLDMQYFASNTSRTSANSGPNISGEGNAPLFIRIRRDATTCYADHSRDKINWVNWASVATSTAFTSAPDTVVIGTSPDTTTANQTIAKVLSFRYGIIPTIPDQLVTANIHNLRAQVFMPPPNAPAPTPPTGWLGPVFHQ